LRKNDWWTAENLYRRAATLDPSSVLAAVGMSRVLLHGDYADAALRWAETAVQADPESVHGALALCEVHVTRKDASKAQAALERLQALSPAHPRVNVLAKHLRELD
jgi:cytochrome c-type biogenesis protein CcmH/NrfG